MEAISRIHKRLQPLVSFSSSPTPTPPSFPRPVVGSSACMPSQPSLAGLLACLQQMQHATFLCAPDLASFQTRRPRTSKSVSQTPFNAQAASSQQPAASNKQQAASSKQQAASIKQGFLFLSYSVRSTDTPSCATKGPPTSYLYYLHMYSPCPVHLPRSSAP
jgi:hypothetical protein